MEAPPRLRRRPDPRQPRFHAPIDDDSCTGAIFFKGQRPALLRIGRHRLGGEAADGVSKRLIVILLRGAVDGLNVVVPYAEEAYYQERGSIAIAPPGKPDGALGARRAFRTAPGARAA